MQGRITVRAAIGFCVASVLVFATVAFAERWMYRNLGMAGAYLAWVVLFIGLGSGALLPAVAAPFRRRFPGLFALAFFAYGACWFGAWAMQPGRVGEIVGAVIGPLLMALVFAAGLGRMRAFPTVAAAILFGNALAYFGGSALNDALGRGPAGMLAWGGVYGLFLGAGLGAALQRLGNPTQGRRA